MQGKNTERTGSQGWAPETANLIGQEDEQEQAKKHQEGATREVGENSRKCGYPGHQEKKAF